MAQLNLTTRNAAVFVISLFTLLFLSLAIASSFSVHLHDQQARFWEYFGGTFSSLMLILKVDGGITPPAAAAVEEK